MKRRIKIYLVLAACTLLLFGCEKKENSVSGNEISANEISANETATSAVSYNYDQEQQIIDDNYRNYYEIFLYSFCDSNGDGIGDINGLIQKLDYINDGDPQTKTDMGFNGIWLMPIMPSTTYHKYDVIDYYSIDPQYGTMEDFEKLVEECDKRGIKLIIDFVYNHTSSQNEWFITACEYLQNLEKGEEPNIQDCPYFGYYNFAKDVGESGGYYQVGTTEWYYEGSFWEEMPDLNLGNEQVRGEIEKIASYWMDLGVGGFRLDAVKEFYSGSTDKNVEVLNWFCNYVKGIDPNAYIIGENWDSFDQIKKFYASGITSQFDFPLAQNDGKIARTVNKQGTALSFGKAMVTLAKEYGSQNPDYIDAPFLGNHDHARVANMFASDLTKMKMAAGLMMTMNGSPFVYYGEEIGMSSMGDKDENKRLPFVWSVTDTYGMTVKPENADADVKFKFAPADEQMKDPLSLLNYYKRGIQLRNENPEIARGTVTVLEDLSGDDICVVKKEYEGSSIYIVYNISDVATTLEVSGAMGDAVAIRGYLTVDGSEVTLLNGSLSLPANAIAVLK